MTWQTLDVRFATAASVSLGFAAGGCYFLGAKALNLVPPRTERRFYSTEAGLSPSTGATFLLPAAAFSPRGRADSARGASVHPCSTHPGQGWGREAKQTPRCSASPRTFTPRARRLGHKDAIVSARRGSGSRGRG